MSSEISCNLAENALDYLLLAGEQAKEGSPRMLKHSLATLADGIELLFKARLEIHDWTQLYSDPAKADRGEFDRGEFVSVRFDQVIERMKHLCSVDFDPAILTVVAAIRQLRNRVRHFALSTDRATVMSLITRTLSIAIDFVGTHIEPYKDTELEGDLAKLRTMLSEFEDFVDTRLAEIETEMAAQKHCPFIDCPACLQRCLYADGEATQCLFCRYQQDGERAADDWELRFMRFQSPKDRHASPNIEQCPECSAEACINIATYTDEDVGYVCLSCGESGDYRHCSQCDQLFESDESEICDDCFGGILDRND